MRVTHDNEERGIMLNLKEVNELRKELLGCHLKDKNGNEIKPITIPNTDYDKYEGFALKIETNTLDSASFYLLESICKKNKLKRKEFEQDGYFTIYTPKKPQQTSE
jgi:hypothetical protein